MKGKNIKIMDEADERLCGVLQQFGFDRNSAKILVYLLDNKQGMSKELEKAADMRQPEVSVGIAKLRKDHMISEQLVRSPTKGKGRPTYLYAIKVSLGDLKKMIVSVADTRIEEIDRCKQDAIRMLDMIKGN